MKPVVVTGATGFVGRHLVAALAAERRPVRTLVRRPPGAAVTGDVRVVSEGASVDELARALEGAAAVIHLAARVHVMREVDQDPLGAFRRVNVDLTRALAEAAIRSGVEAFVFASSVKVMGEASNGRFTEADDPRPVDPYGLSKLEAERALAGIASASSLKVTSLRFPLVYGPGVRANMLALLRAVDLGLPLPLGGIENRRSLLYTGNLAAAVSSVLARPAEGARAFFVSDDEDLSTPEIVRRLGRALDKPARLLPFPSRLLGAAARVGDRLPSWTRFPLRTAVVDRLAGSLAVDCGALRRETGYRPPFSVDEGLRQMALGYRQQAGF